MGGSNAIALSLKALEYYRTKTRFLITQANSQKYNIF